RRPVDIELAHANREIRSRHAGDRTAATNSDTDAHRDFGIEQRIVEKRFPKRAILIVAIERERERARFEIDAERLVAGVESLDEKRERRLRRLRRIHQLAKMTDRDDHPVTEVQRM